MPVNSEVKMLRTIISLPSELKNWIDNYSHINKKTAAETIRQAILEYKNRIEKSGDNSILSETSGIWRGRERDALEYIDKMRSEWE